MNVKIEDGKIVFQDEKVEIKDKALINAFEISKKLTGYMGKELSFRNIKKETVINAEKHLIKYLYEIYEDSTNTRDDFLLTVGFALNMYYITGLYERLGEFDIKKINYFIKENDIKDYIILINNYTFSKIALYIVDIGYTKNKNNKRYKLLIENVENNSYVDLENNYLEEMINQYPQYRYAYMYKLLESISEYCYPREEDKINIEFITYKTILREELFYHILMRESKDVVKNCIFFGYDDYRTQMGIPSLTVKTTSGGIYSPDGQEIIKNNRDPFYCSDIFDEIKSLLVRFTLPIRENIFLNNSVLIATELIEKNQKLEVEKKEKIDLINDFSHRYGKRKASNLKDIAEYLLNIDNEDVRYYGRLALYEVSRKNNIDKDVELLKDTYSDDSEFLGKIRNSTNYLKDKSNLLYIIDETIKNCIITLLYDKTSKGTRLRYKVFNKENPEDIDEILYDYEERVIVRGENALNWLNEQNIIDIRFNIDGIWNDLYFCENEYSAVVLTDILSELIFNAMKYADQTKKIEISFHNDNDFLIIQETNLISNLINSESGKGINSCNTLIKRFHKPLQLDFEPITIDINENMFKEEIRLSKKLFVEE